ncbi:hypothetical protein OROHE_014546 [Orobanche hederae]
MKNWIAAQSHDMTVSRGKPTCGSNVHPSKNSAIVVSDCTGEADHVSVSRILNPRSSKRKCAPLKNREPGPLGKKARRSKATF